MKPQIVPAILTNNKDTLHNSLHDIERNTEWVHIDMLNDSFVPGKTITLETLGSIETRAKMEVHLMTEHPETLLDACRDAGVRRVIVHQEVVEDLEAIAKQASDRGMLLGITLNPDTPAETLPKKLPEGIDLVLALSVTPGKQGQPFQEHVLEKIKVLRNTLPERVAVGIDGGVKLENIHTVLESGAGHIVVGSGIMAAGDPAAQLFLFEAELSKT